MDTQESHQEESKTEVKEEPEINIDELSSKLEQEQEKVVMYEKKIQYLLADFENLKKRSDLEVQNKTDAITERIVLKLLSIYDDFIRAKDALSKQNADIGGLDGILKNMDSLLADLDVKPIDAVGDLFDPKFHEAISIKTDPELDDDTITAELRKGYILKDRVIRPSLVEISKRNKTEVE